ncbi:ABC-2 type transport system permease protein [Methanofollis sp. W23]|uniref:ABC transporter permease n=1 Tax=Methanofollis sp. W23 TaxID=2817849 RepID=UPI001AE777A1|nr:ABC transporter permease subunit [Methanofollis sp. W23]MBP2146697.1 ABC-2 type transport system permease protein [Methanofollis sp. W23]
MRTRALGIIAGKEFWDHVRSRRVHIILAIFLVIAVVGLIDGAVNYQEQIDRYNENLAQTDDEMMHAIFWWKPSILSAFNRMSDLIATVGIVLGCAMGFDLISREKESKSLKMLLSHPIYRDEVINGKALGGTAAIAAAMAIVLLVSFAILLIFGVVPNFDEGARILIFGVISFLLVFSYFAIALFMSTVAESSSNALIYTLIIFIVLSVLVPAVATNQTVQKAVIGEAPEPPDPPETVGGPTGSFNVMVRPMPIEISGEVEEAWKEYEEASQAYWEKRRAFIDTVNLLSPSKNYQEMTLAVTEPGYAASMLSDDPYSFDRPEDLPQSGLEILAAIIGELAHYIIALIVMPAVFFGLAWVKFAREDIR